MKNMTLVIELDNPKFQKYNEEYLKTAFWKFLESYEDENYTEFWEISYDDLTKKEQESIKRYRKNPESFDFRELSNEEVENLPEKTKWKLNNIDKLTFVD
jgi:hypothetical protein